MLNTFKHSNIKVWPSSDLSHIIHGVPNLRLDPRKTCSSRDALVNYYFALQAGDYLQLNTYTLTAYFSIFPFRLSTVAGQYSAVKVFFPSLISLHASHIRMFYFKQNLTIDKNNQSKYKKKKKSGKF